MDAKLTLKLDKYVIERAKEYAASQKRSLSRIIESYLQSLLIYEDSETKEEIEITPLVKSLSGVIDLDADYDFKKDYGEYLMEKYK